VPVTRHCLPMPRARNTACGPPVLVMKAAKDGPSSQADADLLLQCAPDVNLPFPSTDCGTEVPVLRSDRANREIDRP
jgi:hypothetical protein